MKLSYYKHFFTKPQRVLVYVNGKQRWLWREYEESR